MAFVAVNSIGANNDDDRKSLTDRAHFPMLQDVPEVNAWAHHGGGKDDMFIYDGTGVLRIGLRIDEVGTLEMSMATEAGYALVRDSVLEVITGAKPDAGLDGAVELDGATADADQGR